MQLMLFQAPPRSLIRLTQILTEEDVDKLQDAFAGRTIYIPKRSGRKIAVQFIASNPEATREMVIAVCGISRATYYRALKEVQDGCHYEQTAEEVSAGYRLADHRRPANTTADR